MGTSVYVSRKPSVEQCTASHEKLSLNPQRFQSSSLSTYARQFCSLCTQQQRIYKHKSKLATLSQQAAY